MDDLSQVGTFLPFIQQFSVVGLYLFALVANLFPGIPEEVFFVFLGYLWQAGNLPLPFGIIVVLLVIGLMTSDLVLLYLSKTGARALNPFRKQLTKWFPNSGSTSLDKWMTHIIFISRFVMFMRWIGPILAGMHQVSWKKFLKVDIVALFVYVPLMLWLGAYFHNRIDQLIEGVYVVRNIAGIVIAVIVGGSFLWAVKRHMIRHLKKILTHQQSNDQ